MRKKLWGSLRKIGLGLKETTNVGQETEAVSPQKGEAEEALSLLGREIEFKAQDLEKINDLFANLCKYQEGLQGIRGKYRPIILKELYINGTDLLQRENERLRYCQKTNISPEALEKKIADYCRKNKIPHQELYIPREDVDLAVKADLEQKIWAEIKLEQVKVLLRDENCLDEWREEGAVLARQTERSAAEIGVWEQIVAQNKARGKTRVLRNRFKTEMTMDILNNLAIKANPLGEGNDGKREIEAWQKRLALFRENLAKKGIYLDERYEGPAVFEDKISQAWADVIEQDRTLKTHEGDFDKILRDVFRKYPRVGWEYYSALAQEQEKTTATGGLDQYSAKARQNAGLTPIDETTSTRKWVRHRLQRDVERKQPNLNIDAR